MTDLPALPGCSSCLPPRFATLRLKSASFANWAEIPVDPLANKIQRLETLQTINLNGVDKILKTIHVLNDNNFLTYYSKTFSAITKLLLSII